MHWRCNGNTLPLHGARLCTMVFSVVHVPTNKKTPAWLEANMQLKSIYLHGPFGESPLGESTPLLINRAFMPPHSSYRPSGLRTRILLLLLPTWWWLYAVNGPSACFADVSGLMFGARYGRGACMLLFQGVGRSGSITCMVEERACCCLPFMWCACTSITPSRVGRSGSVAIGR
jgi:hypothetical protein